MKNVVCATVDQFDHRALVTKIGTVGHFLNAVS